MVENNSNHNPKSTSTVPNKDRTNSSEKLKLEDVFKSWEEVPNIAELVAESRVDPFVTVPKPPSVIEVNGISLMTLGNISSLHGKAKSGKSNYAIKLCSIILDNNSRAYNRFKNLRPYSNVLYFDTEQGDYHVHLLGNRIVQKAELKPDSERFHLFKLRKHPPQIRLKIIENIIYNTDEVSLVVIDGIADLMAGGYNDEMESIHIANQLLKWTQERNIHIVVVIHENKGNSYMKGHIGSQLMQKCETVLNVAKSTMDAGVTVVSSTYNRGKDIPDDYFTLDENAIPVDADPPTKSNSDRSLKNPSDFDYKFQLEFIEQVYADVSELKYRQLIEKMKYHFAESGCHIGDGKLNDWKIFYLERGIIQQEREKMPYTLNTKFIQSERDKFETL